ncbi:MAG: two-component sensor histidine kinase, partial [Phyllobacterium sp.]
LGLATVKGLVGLHGGELAIRSTPGQGTIVDVRLPRSGRPAAAGEQCEMPAAETANIVEFKTENDVRGGSHGEARKSA